MHARAALAATACILVSLAACSPPPASPPRTSALHGQVARVPLVFEPNVGQAPPDTRFVADHEGYRLLLTARGARFVARLRGERRAIELRVIDGASNPFVTGLDELPGRAHFYLGGTAAGWRTGVPTYARVMYRDVYPGIDLVFHGDRHAAEFDFVVAPGVDPGAIGLGFAGADRVERDRDDVIARAGDTTIRLHRPVVYQMVGDGRRSVDGAFTLDGGRIAFRVGAYDRTRPLVIDPIVTVLAGAAAGGGRSLARDGAGNLYVLRGERIVKLSPDGSAQLYSVMLGTATPYVVAADARGNAYVASYWGFPRNRPGFEDPAFYPVTANALSPGPGNPMFQGDFTAAVAKLGPTGALLYSSFIGGSGNEVTAIAADAAGNFYYTGWTPYTGTFSSTRPPFTGPRGVGGMPAWIQAVAADYSRYIYSALIYDGDSGFQPRGLAVDRTGRVHLTGAAGRFFPTTPGAYQPSPGGTFGSGVVVKIAPDGSRFEAATYFGNQETRPAAIGVDRAGNVYVAGDAAAGLPTLNAVQATHAGGTDAFVARLDPTLSLLSFSTYLGGSGHDAADMLALDASDNVYVAGRAPSTNFPLENAVSPEAGEPGSNFVAQLPSDGRSLVYSTYLGRVGSLLDGLAVTATGTAYVGGSFIARLEPSEVRVFITNPAEGAVVSGMRTADVWAESYVGTSNAFTLSVGSTVLATGTAGNHATLTWDSRRLLDGPQTLLATVRDSRGVVGTARRSVVVRNGTTGAPGAAFTAPAAGATLGGTVTVGMAASNVNGTPITFTLGVDGAQLFTATGTATTASFAWNTTGVANGAHTLTLAVRDGAGRTGSATRSVTVSNTAGGGGGTLKVFITSPAAGATVRGRIWSDVWVEGASAGTRVFTLSAGGAQLASVGNTGNHVTLAWDSTRVPNGTQTLTATVRDATGKTGTGTRAFNVQNTGGTPTGLTAAFTAPAVGAAVSGTTTVGMSATGASGTPIAFTLSVDGASIFSTSGAATTASYAWNTAGLASGTHTLGLTVRDGAGRTATATRTVTVAGTSGGGTFEVFITQPAGGATVRGTVWFTVWSESPAAGAKTYTLTEGGRTLATASGGNGPVSLAWPTTAADNGTRRPTVTVRDAGGASGTAAVGVTIAN